MILSLQLNNMYVKRGFLWVMMMCVCVCVCVCVWVGGFEVCKVLVFGLKWFVFMDYGAFFISSE